MAVYVLHLRNMNYKTTETEIREFFGECTGLTDLVPVLKNGRPSGETFLEFDNEKGAVAALALDGNELKGRRMFLGKSDPASMIQAKGQGQPPTGMGNGYGGLNCLAPGQSPGNFNSRGPSMPAHANGGFGNAESDQNGTDSNTDYVIFIKNMTYDTTEDQLKEFLNNGEDIKTVKFSSDAKNRRNGECFVIFSSMNAAVNAMKLDGSSFHDRKAMLHRSNMQEFNRTGMAGSLNVYNKGNSNHFGNKNNGPNQWDGTVRLCGFTYTSSESTVFEFCQGLKIASNRIVLEKDEQGRTKSSGAVQFVTFSDAEECLRRTKTTLDSIGRYIEAQPSSNTFFRQLLLENAKKGFRQSNGQQSQQNGLYGAGFGQAPSFGAFGGDAQQLNPMGGAMVSPGAIGHSPMSMAAGHNQFNGQMAMASPVMPGAFQQNAGGPMPSSLSQNNFRTTPYVQAQVTGNSAGGGATIQKQEAPGKGPPYPNIIRALNLPSGIGHTNIQVFFKPIKVVAVKLESDGSIDMAFKSHADCLQAMAKNGQELAGVNVALDLRSQPPMDSLTVGSWAVTG